MTEKWSTFKDINTALAKFIVPPGLQVGAYSTERMQTLLERLGNPQNSYKTIHVAGTSGKTSTAYYLASMLTRTGKKIGLNISPHTDNINERVQINDHKLTEKKFASELQIFLNLVSKSRLAMTYFEVITAFAFWEFARQKVEYAVVEVGMGGLLDATNCMKRKDKLCILTDIGLDHTETLGKTVAEITSKKAGIINPYNSVVIYEQHEDVMSVVREVCRQQQAELHEVWPLKPGKLPRMLPLFQRRNWYLAWNAFEFLRVRDELPALTERQLVATSRTYIPARLEVVKYQGKTVIMDVAHNAQKLEALISSLKKLYPKQSFVFIIGFIQTKLPQLKESMAAIKPVANHVYATSFEATGAPKASVSALRIIEACEEEGIHSWQIANSPSKALSLAVSRKDEIIVITGSFYLLNHIRTRLGVN